MLALTWRPWVCCTRSHNSSRVTSGCRATSARSFFIGSLKFGHLERVRLGADNRVVEQEKLFPDTGRMRDVREGPDGLLYLVLESDGKIVRVKP